MKKIKLFLLLLAFLISLFGFAGIADARVRVKGYYRKNGTYVQPHYRSDPDSSRFNNWSIKGNYNPYTGKRGYTNPYKKFKYKRY